MIVVSATEVDYFQLFGMENRHKEARAKVKPKLLMPDLLLITE
jgi:hypothetical protein